jgi:hypothetical protein
MNEIICPHCKKAFKIDEAGYAEIQKQIRDSEFDKEIHNRLELAEKENEAALQVMKLKLEGELQKSKSANESEIQKLKSQIEKMESQNELSITKATTTIEKERDEYRLKLSQLEKEKQQTEAALKDKYETQLKDRDEAIERLRDMKLRLSTKMIGETLEQHCETEFNRIRATAFPRAYFEKDNDARTGSKGDYIFRDMEENGVEIVSIMFEMKNENDETATKKKNEDFLKELDKDRVEKNCEYAVLVSMLEPESELYNSGIVDVSHRFSKMYVVRPQFFIPIITLLRNAAMKSLEYKTELAFVKAQNIDDFKHQIKHQNKSRGIELYRNRSKSTQLTHFISKNYELFPTISKETENSLHPLLSRRSHVRVVLDALNHYNTMI